MTNSTNLAPSSATNPSPYSYPATLNISNVVSLDLTSSNYHLRREQMRNLIEGQDLGGFVSGETPAPIPTIAPTPSMRLTQPNPDYQMVFRSHNPQFYLMKVRHLKKRLRSMVESDKNNETTVEDLGWLCSLSETEIDMLISLKLLIIQRAKMIDCNELADKFDLKMLRGIAFVLMEHLKSEVKDSSLIPDTVKSTAFLDACNLLKCNNAAAAVTLEELNTNIGADVQTILGRRRTKKRRKQKVGSSE